MTWGEVLPRTWILRFPEGAMADEMWWEGSRSAKWGMREKEKEMEQRKQLEFNRK